MSGVDICLEKYKSWCLKLGISHISDINNAVDNGKENQLINISEAWQSQNISEIALKIKEHISHKKIILISGPSSSGKTSFARRLQLHLKVLGIHGVPISLDDYYKDTKDMELGDDGKPDFESPEAIDYSCFNDNVSRLIGGETVALPKFDFDKSQRIPEHRLLKLHDDEVIIAEGLHALNPKFADSISDNNKYKIYCSALTALSHDDGSRIKSRTTRLIRRIIRDFYFRNSSYSYTFSLWANEEKGSEKYIFPYTDTADIIFNSSLLYEFAVYRKYLNNIFAEVPENDLYIDKIRELEALVNAFRPIDRELTPNHSLIREFTGGSSLEF